MCQNYACMRTQRLPENESKRKSELAGYDSSDPRPYHSGISALYDNCDRIQAADRDDQQCSRDPVSATEIQSCQFQGSYGGNRLLAFSWKQCIDHCDHSGSCYCNSFTFRLCYSQKQEK